jgi:hypothetical protein
MSEWGPWIEHDGKGCPCAGKFVESETLDGSILQHIAGTITPGETDRIIDCWIWGECIAAGRIDWCLIRYRIRKPRALLQLIELVENLPERENA